MRWWWAVWAAMLAMAPVEAATYVVVAGVEQYDDAGISPLKYAVADAEAVAAAFREAGVPEANVALLTTAAPDRLRMSTKANLLRALQSAKARAREGDTVIFLFSGHGLELDGVSYLLTMECNRELLATTALSTAEVDAVLRGFQGSNLLLVIDACRNDPDAGKAAADAALDEGFAKGLRPRLQADGAVPPAANVALWLACEIGERAWEFPEEGHGAFTYWLLKGLRDEVPRSADGVALTALADYLRVQVPAWAKRVGRVQEPRLEQVAGGDFWLPAPPRPALGAPAEPQPPVRPGIEVLRREGTLEVTTTLPRVQIELDGQPAGEVSAGRPVRWTRLIGRVTVRGSAPGHVPLERVAEVKQKATTTVALDLLGACRA